MRREERSGAAASGLSLVELLESRPDEQTLLAQLERKSDGEPVFAPALALLTHLQFDEDEARLRFRAILRHRDGLRDKLGRDVGLRVALLDYFVNVSPQLRNPKVIEIADFQRTERSAITDGLTGLHNHAYFLQALKREAHRSKRHGLPLSLVMLDLDDFKRVNDTHGHREGDRILRRTAALVRASLREIDVAARYGGEEFAVILPDTPRQGAYVAAERIRARVEKQFRRRPTPVTTSAGVATLPEDTTTADDLVQKADEALYRSKRDGKNRVSLAKSDRRRHARVPVDYAAKVHNGRTWAARVKNVSPGGLLANLKHRPKLGGTYVFVVTYDDTPRGHEGRIVRVLSVSGPDALYEVGVQFLEEPLPPGAHGHPIEV